ncbi:MAG: DUF4266 domain-containing protein [Kofleriaceae bacterium]
MSRTAIVVVLAVTVGAGCAVVRPHEREHLSRRAMTADQDPGLIRFDQHKAGAREGADGGTGEPGGGCGCN